MLLKERSKDFTIRRGGCTEHTELFLNVSELKNLFIIRARDFTTLLKERSKDFTTECTEFTELFLNVSELKNLFIIRARDFTTQFTEIIKYLFSQKN